GYFLNMTKTPGREIRVLGFQAHGKNISLEPISQFSGYLRSDVTNKQVPVYIMAQEATPDGIPACTPNFPTAPQETLGIPALASFDISTYDKIVFPQAIDEGIPASEFLRDYAPFTVVLK